MTCPRSVLYAKNPAGTGCLTAWLLLAALVSTAVQADETATAASAPRPALLTIADSPMYASEFTFWLKHVAKHYRATQGLGRISDWQATVNGKPLSDYLRSAAIACICNNRAVEAEAEAEGIVLSAEDQAGIDAERNKNRQIYGSQLEYLRVVSAMYGSMEVFDYLGKIDRLGNRLFSHLYGAQAEQVSDETAISAVQNAGYQALQFIHIDGRDKLAKRVLQQLQASKNPLQTFGELSKKYNGQAAQAVLLPAGAISAEFDAAYRQLANNQHSSLIKVKNGNYIIWRLPLTATMPADSAGHSLRYWAARNILFRQRMEARCKTLPIHPDVGLRQLDIPALTEQGQGS